MNSSCFRCKQALVCEHPHCSVCLRDFHPSCSKLDLSYKGANTCCFSKFETISPMATQSSRQNMSKSSSRSSSPLIPTITNDDFSAQSLQDSSSIESKFGAFIANQMSFNNKLSDMINEQNKQLVADQTLFNNRLSDIIKDQNDKLTEIKNIAKSVAEQQVRIQKLEQQNVILSKNVVNLSQQNRVIVNDVHDIREGLANMTKQPSSELIISGIPAELELEPKQMNNANQNDVNNHRTKLSYIVKFKSVYVSRHVIDLKKRKGDLTASEVFDCPLTSKIYINEFLSPRMHSLHCKVKELAKIHKYKYVWVKNGNISVRKEDKSSVIVDRTDRDLRLLETS
ncbi:hypothetical protein PV328_007650 [Microctonus aethiopoides]|uniref:FP protein C-terminal domain-containing protein n=1 Tax=Microctonus aethiopoides TaxID=144406 RepID=A0AA39C962_9HYME|nr:hypothetical protein PV328_007650 [Microctonus aethiopoides]